MKILLVDDEVLLVKGIKFNLENEGYEVEACYDGKTALELAQSNNYDLIILDLMLPGMDGLSVCMAIREFSNIPVIMLTAKTDPKDMLIGFQYGADDYITKPFNILELKARIRVHLRRSKDASPRFVDEELVHGHIALDSRRRRAQKNGQDTDLTVKEFDLLELLMRSPGKVYSREELLGEVWGSDFSGEIRTVDVHVRRLRESFEINPADPLCIRTKWGKGYYFAE